MSKSHTSPETIHNSTENTDQHPLKALASGFDTPEGWNLEYEEPPQWKRDPDQDETITLRAEEVLSRDIQDHPYLDVTGFEITITDSTSLPSYARDHRVFDTEYSLLINGVKLSTKRVVHTAGLSEAADWAHRLINAFENTPEGWVPTKAGSLEILRWTSTEGGQQIALWQEDRNMGEYRSYIVTETTNPGSRRSTRDTVAKDLSTGDLFDGILEILKGKQPPN